MDNKPKTLKDYLIDGGVGGRCFTNEKDKRAFEVVDVYSKLCDHGYTSVFLRVKYLDNKEGCELLENHLSDLEAEVNVGAGI